ncbi:hypothetical protein A1A1_07569 [Planococcus antarcticus DSM 14505]|uniref:Uncharacterized protein n=1 Tax=Planococcus antarcticus DSM 14505 TaxID=1185653 RepID=A0A1C7DHL1_9BACL|nr:hypothetical protein [Planococcus antarcticus]ANU11040.1 hypothetical protein BBH88_12395 [Planococcus antarcticus DSM 14505]EIM07022.1 hypothetical protein A1A1_07569 [Planococcus antarcticus DSM 14505]
MKLDCPYFYIISIRVMLITLVDLDHKNRGSFEWFDNIMPFAFITGFFIGYTDKLPMKNKHS